MKSTHIHRNGAVVDINTAAYNPKNTKTKNRYPYFGPIPDFPDIVKARFKAVRNDI